GTLFLDEIGELPLAQQVKLLTVLDRKQVRRVGDDRPQEVDFRLVAATSRDLRQLVREGSFRAELYFRLDVIRLRVPPLRERPGEIAALAQARARELGAPPLGAEAVALLVRHPWPGNVRELRHAVERAAAVCDGDQLRPEDFELEAEPATAEAPDPATITRE